MAICSNTGERTCTIHCPPMDDPASCFTGKTEAIRGKLPQAPTSPPAHLPASGPVLCVSLSQGALACTPKSTPSRWAPYCILSCLRGSSSNSSCVFCSNSFPPLLLALSHQHTIMPSFSQSEHACTHTNTEALLLPSYSKSSPRVFQLTVLIGFSPFLSSVHSS